MKKINAIFDTPWPLLLTLALATLVAGATSLNWIYAQPQRQAAPTIEPAPLAEKTLEKAVEKTRHGR
jgi:hypothetical protein